MTKIGELFQSADWKEEKHVPVIECPASVTRGENFKITVSLGKEIAHPNTTEHHIGWIQLFYKPAGGKSTYQLGNFEFTAHGQSAAGPNEGPVYTHHSVTVECNIAEDGILVAAALCNIHGLWESAKEIKVK